VAAAAKRFGGEIVRVGGPLCAVLALLLLLGRAARRGGALGGGRPSGVLAVLGRYPVARGQSLVLLRLGARILLLYQSRCAVTALAEISDADEVAALIARAEGAEERRTRSFASLLRGLEARDRRVSIPSPLREAEGGEIIDLTRAGRSATRARRRSWP
jgi:flagellar biogenesis protein FliO